jgi:hypothetical protein
MRRFIAVTVLAGSLICGAAPTAADEPGVLLEIVREGETLPDGNGEFWRLYRPHLNNFGQVAFDTQATGTAGGLDDAGVLLLGDGAVFIQLGRASEEFPDGTNPPQGDLAVHGINDRGQALIKTMIGSFRVVLRVDPVEVGEIGYEGMWTPIGYNTVMGFHEMTVVNDGYAGLRVSLWGGGQSLFRGNSEDLIEIARGGTDYASQMPDGNGRIGYIGSSHSGMNEAGQFAFLADLIDTSGGTTDDEAILRGDSQGLVRIARKGEAAPSGDGIYEELFKPDLSEDGQVAFKAELAETDQGSLDDYAIIVGSDGTATEILRERDSDPEIGLIQGLIDDPAINSAGQVALKVWTITEVVLLIEDGDWIELARSGDPAPGGGNFQSFLDSPILNEAGQVLFRATLSDSSEGLFILSEEGVQKVVRLGDMVAGLPVESIGDVSDHSFNDHGQVVLHLVMTGSLETLYLYTPRSLVPSPVGEVPDGAGGSGSLLFVGKGAGAEIELSWDPSCLPADADYAVYEGSIGDFASHTPVVCSTTGALSHVFTPTDGDRYFLVVPQRGLREGSYGADSAGTPRPPSQAYCRVHYPGECP